MRPIASNEQCISAAEIVAVFEAETGIKLHATNAGNAAKSLGLDYIEVAVERPVGTTWSKAERRYSTIDLPLIFNKLHQLANDRARYRS